jgi:HK97 gp10 family phage protein
LKAKITGLDQLQQKFAALQKATQAQVLKNAVFSGSLIFQNSAVQKVPVVTHNLQRSIHVEVAVSKATYAEAQTGTDVEYAAYVEFGTSKQSAKPYLRPAFDENKDRAKNEVAEALRQQIESI